MPSAAGPKRPQSFIHPGTGHDQRRVPLLNAVLPANVKDPSDRDTRPFQTRKPHRSPLATRGFLPWRIAYTCRCPVSFTDTDVRYTCSPPPTLNDRSFCPRQTIQVAAQRFWLVGLNDRYSLAVHRAPDGIRRSQRIDITADPLNATHWSNAASEFSGVLPRPWCGAGLWHPRWATVTRTASQVAPVEPRVDLAFARPSLPPRR